MNEQQIQQAEETLRQAMEVSDTEALQVLLADNLLFTNHFGSLVSKHEDLQTHSSGELKIESVKLSNQQIQLHESFAVVSVEAQILAVFGARRADGVFMFTRVWVEREGGLHVVAGHVCQKG